MVEKGRIELQFERDFFNDRKYALKKEIIKRHVFEVVKWASKFSGSSLLTGDGKKALDVGCAYGFSSSVLKSLGYDTCGVDVSAWGIKEAKDKSGGSLLVCDAQSNLPFSEDTFDLVTCFDVLEHLNSPLQAMRNMLDVCKGMGSVVCTTPNRTVEKPIRKITRDLDETHVSVKSPAEWEKSIAKRMNCRLLKVETFSDVNAKTANRLLFRSFKMPKLGLTVRILVKK